MSSLRPATRRGPNWVCGVSSSGNHQNHHSLLHHLSILDAVNAATPSKPIKPRRDWLSRSTARTHFSTEARLIAPSGHNALHSMLEVFFWVVSQAINWHVGSFLRVAKNANPNSTFTARHTTSPFVPCITKKGCSEIAPKGPANTCSVFSRLHWKQNSGSRALKRTQCQVTRR